MSAIVMTDRVRLLRAVVFAALCVALAAAAHVAMAGAGVSPTVLAGAFGAVLGLTWLLAGRRRGLGAIGVWMVAAQGALHLLFEQAGTAARGGGAGLGRLATTDWAALLLCNPDRAPGGVSAADLARMAGLDPDVPPPAGSLHVMAGMHHGTAAHAASGGGTAHDAATGTVSGAARVLADGTVWGVSDGASPGTATGMAHGMSHGMSPGMLAAHVLAALACALLLWRGEAALVRLFDLLGALGGVVAGALLRPLLPLLALVGRPLGHRRRAVPRPVDRAARPPRSVLLTHAVVRRGPPAFAFAC
ncbi:hypothetical protein ACPC54_06435 [Kitasatospora sp. NPDC094028]